MKTRSISFVSPFGYPLLVPDGQGSGGAERQFVLFGHELASLGWHVSFITAHPAPEYRHQQTILPVYSCSFSYLGGSNFRIPIDWISLFMAMKKSNSYYYIIKTPGHLLAPMSLFCRLFNKKLVFWGQTTSKTDPSLKQISSHASYLQNWGIKQADLIIAQTKDQQNSFKKNYNLNSTIVPNICTTLPYAYQDASSINALKTIDVLWAGNSTTNKRYEVVIELAKNMPEARFSIAMNLSEKKIFEKCKTDCSKIPNIQFLGTVPPHHMESLFSETKIFLNTSIREGFPNTYLQSWMNGVPVISLNIDPDNTISTNNIGEIVNKQFGITQKSNFKYLALQLKPLASELLGKEELRAKIAQKAKAYIVEHHTPDTVVPILINALENYANKKTLPK